MTGIRHMKSPASKAWLWKLGFFFAIAGGVLTWYLYQHISDSGSRKQFSFSLLVTVLFTGICWICATANWWMKR